MKSTFLMLATVMTLATQAMATNFDLSSQTAQAPIQFIDVDGAQIAHRVIGDGEPILLLNRFRADMNHWDPIFVDRLAQTRKVILLDYPGMGLSGGMPKATADEMADDLVRFMDEMGLANTDVVGWSLGTVVGLTAATKYPNRFQEMALIGAIYAGGMEQARITPDIQGFLQRAGKPEPTVEDFVYILFGDTDESKKLGVEALKRRALWETPGTDIPPVEQGKWMRHLNVINTYQSTKTTVRSLEVNSPLLFINGDRDHIAPPRVAAEWIQVFEHAELAVVRSGGHNVHGQNPEELSKMVLEFLE